MDTNKKTTDQPKAGETFKMTGNWTEESKQLKVKYPTLNDTDLKLESGKEDEMINRVATKLNKKHDEVTEILKNLHTKKA